MTSAVAVYENATSAMNQWKSAIARLLIITVRQWPGLETAPTGTLVSNLTSATSDRNVTSGETSTTVKQNSALPIEIPVPSGDSYSKNAVNSRALTSSSFGTPFEKGVASLAAAKYAAAAEFFRQAVRLDPRNALAYSRLGVAYCATDEHKRSPQPRFCFGLLWPWTLIS